MKPAQPGPTEGTEDTKALEAAIPRAYKRVDGSVGVPPEACAAVSWGVHCGTVGGVQADAVVAANDLARVFQATRMKPVPASGETEPVGAAVNFNLSLKNLKGRTVEVRWSMYRIGSGSPLPEDWLVNRRVSTQLVEGSMQTVSNQFWVPLPHRPGPFFVRISAWDGANRLDFEDSKPPFR